VSKPATAEDRSNSEPIDTELLARAEAAILTLPRFTREVFLAHRIDDLSYAEIARLTGTSVRRIEREMARGLYGFACAMEGQPLRWWEWWW
jgi:RNA polymerase sigma-70 factor (ECF subfamily)